jgi:transposase InsO family protein
MRIKPREIILTYKKHGCNIKAATCELGIHKSTVYRWLKRARTGWGTSSRNLHRKSTKPKNINTVLSSNDKGEIAKLREKYGWDAEKITASLNLSSSGRTTHRFLKKKGLVREYNYSRRPLFQDTIHMHAKNAKTIGYLQMDVKYITPELSGLPWTCFEYAVIDIFSRYKEALILNHLDQDGSISALLEIIPKLPFKPVFLQTDNGLEFQKRFRDHVKALGLNYHYIHKSTPNGNALIERSFRTDEEEFFFRLQKRPQHYDELRELFSKYLYEYNYIRPHHGIDLKTPYEVVANVLSD